MKQPGLDSRTPALRHRNSSSINLRETLAQIYGIDDYESCQAAGIFPVKPDSSTQCVAIALELRLLEILGID